MGLAAVLLGAAGVCWVLTIALMGNAGDMGGSGGMATNGISGLGWFSLIWTVMMAAMMLPSLAPMVLTYSRANAARQANARSGPASAALVFVVGYLVSWAAAGVAGYLLAGGIQALAPGLFSASGTGRFIAGGVIAGAALYQFTRLKGVCLRHCRTPVLLAMRWRPGIRGALRTGIEHGGHCIGATWALMAVLAVLGLMNLGWMAVITGLVALEKLLPRKVAAARGIAVFLVILGLTLAFVPQASLPGFASPPPAQG